MHIGALQSKFSLDWHCSKTLYSWTTSKQNINNFEFYSSLIVITVLHLSIIYITKSYLNDINFI